MPGFQLKSLKKLAFLAIVGQKNQGTILPTTSCIIPIYPGSVGTLHATSLLTPTLTKRIFQQTLHNVALLK